MSCQSGDARRICAVVSAAFLALVVSFLAAAHCDTLDGPVVTDAKIALEKKDITAVLKWVPETGEKEVRAAFDSALSVRGKGADAKELADRYFFETLVRVHRAGEGVGFTGLKPGGAAMSPAIREADGALESGKTEKLRAALDKVVLTGLEKRFGAVVEARKHKDSSVEAGRRYVEAYVQFVHYAERIYADASGEAGEHESPSGDAHEAHAQKGIAAGTNTGAKMPSETH